LGVRLSPIGADVNTTPTCLANQLPPGYTITVRKPSFTRSITTKPKLKERNMKKAYLIKVSSVCLTALFVFLGSGCIPTVKYERVVQLSEPMAQVRAFEAETHNGSITINGAAVNMCDVTATITARAESEEEAKKIADQTQVRLERSGNRLTARIEKPILIDNKYVGVAYDVTISQQVNLDLITHNGSVDITNTTGKVTTTTHNGRVTTQNVTGDHRLTTHNGRVECHNISGDVRLETHNGSVDVVYSNNAPPPGRMEIVTHNGGIDFTSPPNFSAQVEASTHNGSIHTALPITVVGEVSKRELRGTIGSGQGRLHLETHNGSITIK
jgi:hypothetical protein